MRNLCKRSVKWNLFLFSPFAQPQNFSSSQVTWVIDRFKLKLSVFTLLAVGTPPQESFNLNYNFKFNAIPWTHKEHTKSSLYRHRRRLA